ncbi:MAG: glycosyltransferase [Spirochaetes bacterium]|nr:glycosyltransferase [Spirochaetota bacterium]
MKNKIKVYIHYNITDQPWGGGNSFLKSFKKYIVDERNNDFAIVDNIKDEYDVFFMNGGHKDQGVYLDIKEIKKVKRKRGFFLKKHVPKIIYRLDGARYKYNKEKSIMDKIQYDALQLADYTIFQSKECLDSFQALGYNGNNYTIIHNGVNQDLFNLKNKKRWNKQGTLNILSCNWSSNLHKGFKTISEFSLCEKVTSYFVGRWNNDIAANHVKVTPPLTQDQLVQHYLQADVFLHAAKNDPCPNVVLEAMSCGLPVIYHNSGGTPDIAGNYGIKLPEVINSDTIKMCIDEIMEKYDFFYEKIVSEREAFSIKKAAERYLDIFTKVVYNEI